MRRWNGWGEESITYPLSPSALQFLATLLGKGTCAPDASLESVLPTISNTILSTKSIYTTEPLDRLKHARGQSTPDWIALRSGRIGTFPDAVAYPQTQEQVKEIIDFAKTQNICLIPYGGGTSVVGHINPLPGERPILTVDLSSLDKLIHLDETSRLATFEAGVRGPDLERQLNAQGFTLGHYPQSFEFSTLGGWIATRSCGQQSDYYGRIEDLFAGGRLETPTGAIDLPAFPASAAGPDLRQMILGSEGRLGILTKATVRIQPIPEVNRFYGTFFPNWQNGVTAAREIVQSGCTVSMLRLSNPLETEVNFWLSGKDRQTKWARLGLNFLGYKDQRCLLINGITGDMKSTKSTLHILREILKRNGGLFTGEVVGKTWQRTRFITPYLRNTLWEHGYAVDTIETSVNWSNVIQTGEAIQESLRSTLMNKEKPVLVFTHLSHVYPDGASIYTTIIFCRSNDPAETLADWELLKKAVSAAIITSGGTISHQHGIGIDHAPYLAIEKGKNGINMLKAVSQVLDPNNILNPGKLINN